MTTPAPGWYPNPDPNTPGNRYWDGSQWTMTDAEYSTPAAPVAAQAPAYPTYPTGPVVESKGMSFGKKALIGGGVVLALVVVGAAMGSEEEPVATDTASAVSDDEQDAEPVDSSDEPAEVEEPKEEKPDKPEPPPLTGSQEQAISAAENYLALGSGFSRAGLIEQLSSDFGSGFAEKDAVFAVDYLKINWNEQAVLAAENYLDLGMGFSRDGLIEQLTAAAGSKFTQEQAVFAVNKVGL